MRLVTSILVAAQVVWGGDVYFLDHNMLPHLVSLFSASRKEQWEQRLRNQAHFQAIGEHLPKGARLVVHEVHPHLGTGVPTYDDYQTYQFGLAYGLMKSPRELWQKFRDMGITHLFWKDQQSQSWDTVAGDIMFLDMALRHGKNPKKFTSAYDTWVAELPAEPPEDEAEFDDTVAVMGCAGRGYPSGLYRVRDLHVPIFGPRRKAFPEPRTPLAPGENALSLARQAAYVVLDPSCNQGAARKLPADFSLAARRRVVRKVANVGYHIYMRLPHDERPPPRKASSRARARPKPDADDR